MEYPVAIAIILPIAAASLLVILFFKRKWRSPDKYPPVAATMVGHILNFKRLHDFLYDHHRRLKTFRIAYPNFSLVCTVDPANVEHILRSNFANYIKVSEFSYIIFTCSITHNSLDIVSYFTCLL